MKYFKKVITNVEESHLFLDRLQSDYPMLHPEDDMNNIIENSTGERTFTEEQAEDLHNRYDEVYEYLDDPCEYILKINKIYI